MNDIRILYAHKRCKLMSNRIKIIALSVSLEESIDRSVQIFECCIWLLLLYCRGINMQTLLFKQLELYIHNIMTVIGRAACSCTAVCTVHFPCKYFSSNYVCSIFLTAEPAMAIICELVILFCQLFLCSELVEWVCLNRVTFVPLS